MSHLSEEPTLKKTRNDEGTKQAQIKFGLQLKNIREDKNVSRQELQQLTGIDVTILSELERGLYTPSLVIIGKLAIALEINPHVLISAYYGTPLPQFDYNDKQTLDSFIQIALNYLKQKESYSEKPKQPSLRVMENIERTIAKEEARRASLEKQPSENTAGE